jgi:N-methylhydantoinase A
VITPLAIPALEERAGERSKLDVEAVAVFFMNSYVNPSHEAAAAEVLREHLPDVYVTFSTDLTHEWYEYERCSTVAANAYVGPQVSTYVRRLDSDLKAQGFTGSLFMMGSNGGLLSAERTCRQPIGLVESGPIGGCIGASAYAEALGFKNVVAFDMGGTTAKSALVENGRFSVNSVYYVGGYVRGFPIKSSVIDSSKWARGEARSPGSIRRSDSTSVPRARVRRRGRYATAAAAASRRSPTQISFSAGSTPITFSAAK